MWETPQMVFFGEVQKIISDMTQEKSKTLYVCVYALSHILVIFWGIIWYKVLIIKCNVVCEKVRGFEIRSTENSKKRYGYK